MTISHDKIAALFEQRPIPVDKIVEELAAIARNQADGDFEIVLELACMDELYDEILAAPAMALIPSWGKRGIETLVSFAFDENKKVKTKQRAIEVLLAISAGEVPQECDVNYLPNNWSSLEKYAVSEELKQYSSMALREQILSSLVSEDKKVDLFFMIGMSGMTSYVNNGAKRFQRLLDLTIDSHLILNVNLLQRFEGLLDSGPSKEEELQKFLTAHPILLDPFTNILYSKHELGSDFITDFVIRRMNDQYVLVEIENSTDRLFAKNGSFTASLSTAIGQVRDFQAWVAENISYAQKKLPNIKYPEGLVIIGRRKELGEIEVKRLNEENHSRRGHIKIITYDDLLEQAKAVHRNLIDRPPVVKSKDNKAGVL